MPLSDIEACGRVSALASLLTTDWGSHGGEGLPQLGPGILRPAAAHQELSGFPRTQAGSSASREAPAWRRIP